MIPSFIQDIMVGSFCWVELFGKVHKQMASWTLVPGSRSSTMNLMGRDRSMLWSRSLGN